MGSKAAVREQADRGWWLFSPRIAIRARGFTFRSHICTRNPQATVAIYPSDHFVHPEEKFIEEMRYAVWAPERYEDKVMLLGAPSDR